jgi:hypothetical protein
MPGPPRITAFCCPVLLEYQLVSACSAYRITACYWLVLLEQQLVTVLPGIPRTVAC